MAAAAADDDDDDAVAILTVPHAVCPPQARGHMCDIVAPSVAKAIWAAGGDAVEAPYVPSNTPRTECDLNRTECRDHPFRNMLRERLLREPRVGFVIDVHSFWRTAPTFSPHELVVLDDVPSGGTFPTSYVRDYAQMMAKRGVDIAVIRGIKNDIIDEMRTRGVPAFLLEFNESLSGARMRELAIFTATWLRSRLA